MIKRLKTGWRIAAIAVFFFLAVSVVCGYYVTQTLRQAELVDAIETVGGNVEYCYQIDYEDAHGHIPEDLKPNGVRFLRDVFGIDAFNSIGAVQFGPWCSDIEVMKRCGEFRSLRVLRIEDERVDNTLLSWVGSARNLERVYLGGCSVDDRIVGDLASLPRLRVLDLRYTHVSDNGLRMLSKSKSLRELILSPKQASEATLRSLQADNPECQISDGG